MNHENGAVHHPIDAPRPQPLSPQTTTAASRDEIRDSQQARLHLLHGLLLARAAPLTTERVQRALRWSKEMAGQGWPLPPLGFIADIGELVVSLRVGCDSTQLPSVPGLDHTVTLRYEDYVLGKLAADPTFQRGADAILKYVDRDRDRAIAFLVNQLCRRGRVPGTQLSPGVIETLLKQAGADVLQEAWSSVEQKVITDGAVGISAELVTQIEKMITAIRNAGSALGPEDLFELESGTVLVEFGQRVALRQLLQTVEQFEQSIPHQRPRNSRRRYSVSTRLQQEDEYPIGGFSSISNRGTIESLVRSELAYMDPSDRPDLFDIKYARNELLYYSRDENQFLRRRLAFAFVLDADLIAARFKDPQLPVQRMILLLASLVVAVRQLTRWLSGDSLRFVFLWVDVTGESPLMQEQQLIETVLHEAIALGTVEQRNVTVDQWPKLINELKQTSFCQGLYLSTEPNEALDEDEWTNMTSVRIDNWTWETWHGCLREWLETWCVA